MDEIKTSAQWVEETDIKILDPDGWDRANYEFAFNEEEIDLKEFLRRVQRSTIDIPSFDAFLRSMGRGTKS